MRKHSSAFRAIGLHPDFLLGTMSTKKRGKKDSGVESAASAALPDVMQQCAAILKSLLAMPEAEPFAVPVDW